MKIPKKYSQIVFAFLIALILPFVMTFFIALINLGGFNNNFIAAWMKAYIIAFIIAFPAVILIAPLIRKITEKITA